MTDTPVLPPAATVQGLLHSWCGADATTARRFGATADWCLLALTGAPLAGKTTAAAALQAHGVTVLDTMAVVRLDAAQHWPDVAPLLCHPDEWYAANVRLQSLAVGRCPVQDFAQWVSEQGLALCGSRTAAWVLAQWQAWRLSADPAWWLRQRAAALQQLLGSGHRLVVVDSVSTAAECEWIHALDGAVVCVMRPTQPQPADAAQLPWDGHVLNDGTPDRLAARTLNVMLQLFGPEALKGVQ